LDLGHDLLIDDTDDVTNEIRIILSERFPRGEEVLS
jgi:hypothetical protein